MAGKVLRVGSYSALPPDQQILLLQKTHPGVWATSVRGFTNAPLHWEWYRLMMDYARLCIIAPREHSKALALDTPVLTPAGHKPMRDVQVGDVVLDRDGKATTVTVVSEVYRDHDCYRVRLDDGQEFVADAGHRWITHYAGRGEQVVTTQQIKDDHSARNDQRHVIDCPAVRRSHATGRTIVAVDPTLSVPVRCLTTEAGSYLIGEGVVTHNTEVFTVNQTAWRSIYQQGTWTYVFASTLNQAKALKERVDDAVHEARPDLFDGARLKTATETVYGNGSKITVASAGSSVRGAHPDVIVGDDVLEEDTCFTAYQRDKTKKWWKGTIAGMQHPMTSRIIRDVGRVVMPPTRTYLVGTPFHNDDLLMSMRANPLYTFYRYAAEFREEELLPDSLAVEAA